MHLIGWDCAVDAKKCGIAFGEVTARGLEVESVETGLSEKMLISAIVECITSSGPCLLAIDAPLGWPSALGQALASHEAGGVLPHLSNELFRRSTDLFIKKTIGKQPLDVGADRIARTALSALQRLEQIRENTKQPLPLAWVPGHIEGSACIEVYPAGSLTVYGLSATGYKGKESKHQAARNQLVAGLSNILHIPDVVRRCMRENDDALDAVVCLQAGFDFMQGVVMRPDDQALAEKEGWIWVRQSR